MPIIYYNGGHTTHNTHKGNTMGFSGYLIPLILITILLGDFDG